MPLRERDVAPLKDVEDIHRRVRHDHERQFAQLLLNKSFEITYEPILLEYKNGSVYKHIPDFGVLNPRTGTRTIVEITTSQFLKGTFEGIEWVRDPKEREKVIVQHIKEDEGLDFTYVVLYAGELMNIQNKNEGLDFFREKNQQESAK